MFNDMSKLVVNEALFQHYSFDMTKLRCLVETSWSNDKDPDIPLGLFHSGLLLVKALDILEFSFKEEHEYF